jgi:hypothetical protein
VHDLLEQCSAFGRGHHAESNQSRRKPRCRDHVRWSCELSKHENLLLKMGARVDLNGHDALGYPSDGMNDRRWMTPRDAEARYELLCTCVVPYCMGDNSKQLRIIVMTSSNSQEPIPIYKCYLILFIIRTACSLTSLVTSAAGLTSFTNPTPVPA